MSVLDLSGRRFAAGLYWLERGNAVSVARNARAFGRPWHVHWGEQTGYAADEEDPGGCPSLAAALQAHVGTPFWMALVEADDGRLALIKARDGAILADGDEVFADRASALEAFERARDVGWALHATPGLVEGDDVAELDPSALADDPAMRLAAVPLARLRLPKTGRFLALAAAVAVAAALVWTERESLWRLIAGPEPVEETNQEPVEPPVMTALDAGVLIAGCRRALRARPPYLPGWRTERVACEGRFADPALIVVRPELEDRAVLVVRWRLETGRSEPVHRRIAEAHLSGWYAASVADGRAWAVASLAPALVLSEAAPPSLLEFREAVDRRFGARGTDIEYPSRSAEGIEVRIATRRPPARLADTVAAVAGLELVRLARDGAGAWRLEGRRVSPVAMRRERFHEVSKTVSQTPSQAVSETPVQIAPETVSETTAEPVATPVTQPAAEPAVHPARGRKHDD